MKTSSARDNSTGVLRVKGFRSTPLGAFTSLLRTIPSSTSVYTGVAEHFEDAVRSPNCFLPTNDLAWVDNSDNWATTRGWIAPNTSCSSSTRVREDTNFAVPAEDLYRRLGRQADMIRSVKDRVRAATGSNFSKVIVPVGHSVKVGRFRVCEVETAFAVRVLSTEGRPLWYMLTGITNAPIEKYLPDWERLLVTELVGVDLEAKSFLDPLQQDVLPIEAKNVSDAAVKVVPREKFSTVLEQWSGKLSLSAMYKMTALESPAVTAGLEATSRDNSQATDGKRVGYFALLEAGVWVLLSY